MANLSILPDLYNHLRTTLLRCESFGSNDALEAVFVDARINEWAADLPLIHIPASANYAPADLRDLQTALAAPPSPS